VFRVVNGGTPTSDPEHWDGEVPWATPVDIGRVNGSVLTTTDRTLTELGLRTGSRLVPAESLILSTRAPIGYVARTAVPTAFNQGCKGLELATDGDVRYFLYQFAVSTDPLAARGQGSTFIELSAEALSSAPVVVPPPVAQRAIADFLDSETARIDALIAKKRQLVHLIEQRFRTLRRFTVEGGAGSRADDQGWHRVRLRFLVERPVSGVWGKEPGEDEVDVACLRVADFDRWEGVARRAEPTMRSISHSELSNSRLATNDLLIEKSGGGERSPVGYVTRFMGFDLPAVSSNFVARLRPLATMHPAYLAEVFAAAYDGGFNLPYIKQTTGIQNLDLGAFLGQPWVIPPLAGQVSMAAAIAHARRIATSLRGALALQIELLAEHRQALITAAVTGEFDVAAEFTEVPS
jgi:type I restriction enzyme S subunit